MTPRFKKYLIAVSTSYATLIPCGLGFAVAVLSAASGVRNATTGLLAGLAGITFGVGMFFTRLLNPSKSIQEKVDAELKREAQEEVDSARREYEAQLDQLREALTQDGDRKTQAFLDDLRTLRQAFLDGEFWQKNILALRREELLEKVNQLFEVCVRKLRLTLQLLEQASKITTKSLKKTILERRTTVLADIEQSIETLGKMLHDFQVLGIEDQEDVELGRLNQELDQLLTVTTEAEQATRDWEREAKM